MRVFRFWLFWAILVGGPSLFAQPRAVVVDSVLMVGNKYTRSSILYRELDFKVGDTLYMSTLAERLELNRQRLVATHLFTLVGFQNTYSEDSSRIQIRFVLDESWYIWPVPIFELADRNVNVWLNEMDGDWRRTNFGLTLIHMNTTGRRDELNATFQYGFAPKYDFEYKRPYINKKQTIGFRAGGYQIRTRDVGYITRNNLLVYHADPKAQQLLSIRIHLLLRWRPKIYTRHELAMRYYNSEVSDTIARVLNPDFLLNGANELQFFSVGYSIRIDKRDVANYPRKGHLVETTLRKDGLELKFEGRNAWRFDQTLGLWRPLFKRWVSDSRLFFTVQYLPKRSDFLNYRALGYGARTLRGYEYYVINGTNFFMAQESWRYRILDRKIDVTHWNWKRLQKFDIMLGASANFDVGYVRDPYFSLQNNMTNRWLSSTGLGLDFLYFGSSLMQFHYAINHLGERRAYLQLNVNM